MHKFGRDVADGAPRRGFFRRICGATALGVSGLMPMLADARAATVEGDGPDWPGKLPEIGRASCRERV